MISIFGKGHYNLSICTHFISYSGPCTFQDFPSDMDFLLCGPGKVTEFYDTKSVKTLTSKLTLPVAETKVLQNNYIFAFSNQHLSTFKKMPFVFNGARVHAHDKVEERDKALTFNDQPCMKKLKLINPFGLMLYDLYALKGSQIRNDCSLSY